MRSADRMRRPRRGATAPPEPELALGGAPDSGAGAADPASSPERTGSPDTAGTPEPTDVPDRAGSPDPGVATEPGGRIAALWAPDWPLQALVRADPELARARVAVDGGRSETGGILVAVSPAALAAGVRAGMRVAQARSLCPELVVRKRDAALELSASEALRDVAFAFSPRVELDEATPGWAHLDVSGLERLVGPAAAVARGLAHAGEKLGLELRVGVARTKTLARLAALAGDGCQVLPADPRRERRFLAGLPLAALEPDDETARALERFGLRTVADLWKLPRNGLAARLGPGAARLYGRALGEEEGGGLTPAARKLDFVERLVLDWSIAELEPLAFVLRGMIDRLVARLSLHGFVGGDVRLSLGYEGQGGCEREVRVSAPTRDVRALVDLCRVHLAEHPPEAAVASVTVTIVPEGMRPRQLSFFVPAGPAPEKLAVTLARLRALCGPDRVGAPRPLDSWATDRFAMASFGASEPSGPPDVGPVAVPPLTLRRLRPPPEVEVICAGERPVALGGRAVAGGRIVQVQGPFRRSRPWWEPAGDDEPVDTGAAGSEPAEPRRASPAGRPPDSSTGPGEVDCYDVTLSDGRAYRLAYDRRQDRWRAEGWYD